MPCVSSAGSCDDRKLAGDDCFLNLALSQILLILALRPDRCL